MFKFQFSRFLKFLPLFMFVIMFGMIPAALAAPVNTPALEVQPFDISQIIENLFGVVVLTAGASTLGTALVNIGKQLKWKGNPLIPDSQAMVWSNRFSFIFALGLGATSLFAPGVDLAVVDAKMGDIAGILLLVLPTVLLIWNWLAPKIHNAIRGVWGIGFSHPVYDFSNTSPERFSSRQR